MRALVHHCRHLSVFRIQNVLLNSIRYGIKVKDFLPQIDCGSFVYLFEGTVSADRTSQPRVSNSDLYSGGKKQQLRKLRFFSILYDPGSSWPAPSKATPHSCSDLCRRSLQPGRWHDFLLPPPCTPWGLDDRAHPPQWPAKEDFVTYWFKVMGRRYYLSWNSCFRAEETAAERSIFRKVILGPMALGM